VRRHLLPILLLAFSACSSSTQPADNPVTTTTPPTDKPDKTRSANPVDAVARAEPLKVERALPDADWNRAADVLLAELVPSISPRPEITRIVVKPLVAPDGTSLPYLLQYELYAGARRDFFESLLVTNGKLGGTDGLAGASAYLKSVGFPAKHASVGLVYELFTVFNLVPSWLSAPSHDWTLLQASQMRGMTPITIAYEGTSAAITVVMLTNLDRQPLFTRLVIHVDASAAITFTSDRETDVGTWTPIPVKL
jgi:hypothetical protein